jgi:hypothetical protein
MGISGMAWKNGIGMLIAREGWSGAGCSSGEFVGVQITEIRWPHGRRRSVDRFRVTLAAQTAGAKLEANPEATSAHRNYFRFLLYY